MSEIIEIIIVAHFGYFKDVDKDWIKNFDEIERMIQFYEKNVFVSKISKECNFIEERY